MTKYTVKPSTRFRRDYKLILKQGKDESKLNEVVKLLASGETLPEKYRDHALAGDYVGCRECHIQPDWLLIYEIVENDLILYLIRIGSHSDLF